MFISPYLSIRLNPNKTTASINVNYYWASAGSYNIEKFVTSPLEAGFATLKGIKKISSKSSQNYGYITLEMDKYTDIDALRFEVSSTIRRIYNKLPPNVSYPVISVNKPEEDNDNTPIVSYSIIAPYPTSVILEDVQNKVVPVLGSIKGIDKISVFGATPNEYQIVYNKSALESIDIDKKDLIRALQRYFNKTNLGYIRNKNDYTGISIYPPTDTISWKIPVKKIKDRIVYLDQITEISKHEQQVKQYYRINGMNAIGFYITAEKNTNTIALAKKINDKIVEISATQPENFQIIKINDTTEYLKKELDKIYKRSIYTLLILLLFVLLVSFSFKYLFIIITGIIINLSLAFLLYRAFNVELHLYSLAGMTISLGLIIDNIIVMTDHIRILKNKKVFIPILASTITTLGALSVIFFMDEKLKLNLIDFALVLIINLGISLVVALFYVPAIIEKIHLHSNKKKIRIFNRGFRLYSAVVNQLVKYRYLIIIAGILSFGIPLFMLPSRIDNPKHFYENFYNKTIGNKWYLNNVKPYADKYLGGSFRLFSYYVFENSRFGEKRQTKLYVNASMEKGATINQINEAILPVENFLKQFTEIEKFITNIYSSDYAGIEIVFKPEYEKSIFPYILKSKLIKKALDQGGIDWNIYGVGDGFVNKTNPGMFSDFRLQGKGYNYDKLKDWADTLKVMLEKHPRVKDVVVRDNSLWYHKQPSQYRLTLDKENLTLNDNTPLDIHRDIKELTVSNSQDLNLFIKGRYIPVRFTSRESNRFDIWHLKNTMVGVDSHPLKLNKISSINKEPQQENIFKENQEYLIRLEYQYTGSRKFGEKYLNKVFKKFNAKLPLGYKFSRAKYIFFNKKSKKQYVYLLFLIIVIIIFICSILFENLKQAFIILSVIPISFIGVFLTFYYFNIGFDQGGIGAFILLSGITINSSIYILDQYNQLRKKHPLFDKRLLYLLAFKYKIFPIILTILSTLLGFIPFLIIGKNDIFWYSLAAGTIGGLIFSLIAIVIFLPVLMLKYIKTPSVFQNKSAKPDKNRGSQVNK